VTLRALSVLSCLSLGACFHTVYRNLQPVGAPRPAETPQTLSHWRNTAWHHYFENGFLPRERQIDAVAICGGEGHVKSLETGRTFLQSLVSYAQIYTPWDQHVTCDHSMEP